jgi:beta-lactamase class A
MKPALVTAVVIFAIVCGAAADEDPQAPAPDLRARVQTLIDASGAEVAVALRTIDGKRELLIDPDKTFHAASTMKVPIMIELFRQAEGRAARARRTSRHQKRVPQHRRRHYQLSVGDDSDAEVYKNVGKTMTLRDLCEAMIHHDAAIVYGPHPYVLVVLTRGIQNQKVSAALLASISREIWNELSK